MRYHLVIAGLVFAAAFPPAASAKQGVTAFFQLGGVLWIKDYTPYTINGYQCVAASGIDFCGPTLMESGEDDFLAWARFVRRPEKFFKSLDMYLGDNVLAAIIFEERLKEPEPVFFWKDGLDRNLYLRLPWPYTVNQLGAWIKGPGREEWAYIVEHHQETVFDPAKRRWNPGQFTYDSLKQGGRAPTRIVYADVAKPEPPKENERLALKKTTLESLVKVLRGEGKALDGFIAKESKKAGTTNEPQVQRAVEEIGRLKDQVKALSQDPENYCPDCAD